MHNLPITIGNIYAQKGQDALALWYYLASWWNTEISKRNTESIAKIISECLKKMNHETKIKEWNKWRKSVPESAQPCPIFNLLETPEDISELTNAKIKKTHDIYVHARRLFSTGRLDEAEKYLLKHRIECEKYSGWNRTINERIMKLCKKWQACCKNGRIF
jgi:hypothetical protein